MHNIKSVLSGAEKLFFAMGYNRDPQDPETFKLETRLSVLQKKKKKEKENRRRGSVFFPE